MNAAENSPPVPEPGSGGLEALFADPDFRTRFSTVLGRLQELSRNAPIKLAKFQHDSISPPSPSPVPSAFKSEKLFPAAKTNGFTKR